MIAFTDSSVAVTSHNSISLKRTGIKTTFLAAIKSPSLSPPWETAFLGFAEIQAA